MRPMGVVMKGLLKKGSVPSVQAIRTDVRRCGNPKPPVDDSEPAVLTAPRPMPPPRTTPSSHDIWKR
jgi:hypothetical protein